jgi:putative transposase
MTVVVRYGDGGGVGPGGRVRREQVRQRAAVMFADGKTAVEVAAVLEVSTKSAYAWRRAWVAGGTAGLAARGASGPSRRLSEEQLGRLQARLEAGPAAAGYVEDQRWTLARVSGLIATMFHVRLSLPATSAGLRRLGWTPQQPAHRAVEQDTAAVEHWRRYQWPALKGSRAGWARGSVSPTSPATR